MKKIKVYVDGQSGTTGLQINERLAGHPYVEILRIPEEDRRNEEMRRQFINKADVVFLCLPDQAAVEAAALVDPDNQTTRIIDASTAHRTHPQWVYGLPELSPVTRTAIAAAVRLANPGCHATAFLLPVSPLVAAGILPADYPVSCHSITGYTGGGKVMIAEYEDPQRQERYPDYDAPREYALGQAHKHLPEMQKYAGLAFAPSFSPIVASFPRGLAVFTHLETRLLRAPQGETPQSEAPQGEGTQGETPQKKASPQLIREVLAKHYQDSQMVQVMPYEGASCQGAGYLNVKACNDKDRAEIFVFGNEERITLACRLDNLGKGAGGAAIQNMNIMMGLPEDTGLVK
ncbi:MAG: N-acetyl-gamma-glutamyl-phosphate reductase [Clostridiales bacterium]